MTFPELIQRYNAIVEIITDVHARFVKPDGWFHRVGIEDDSVEIVYETHCARGCCPSEYQTYYVPVHVIDIDNVSESVTAYLETEAEKRRIAKEAEQKKNEKKKIAARLAREKQEHETYLKLKSKFEA